MTQALPPQDPPTSAEAFFCHPHPGARPFDAALIKKLEKARQYRGNTYQPRTRHLRGDGWARYTNRLFLESSPYLLQHAHNPVNWYPWGDEAFETARKRNRPVFLSVGYATCHWCHVMEEESFEDEEIAAYLNAHFICVKLDREERPDIDSLYMTAVQALTGRGGWPMSVWLTADRKPFYGGTYFPARDGDRGVGMGFLTICKNLHESFHARDGRVENAGAQITTAIQKIMTATPGTQIPGKEIFEQALAFYRQNYDRQFGGLKGVPKFPSSLPVRFLLRCRHRTPDTDILGMIETSLLKMADGGMYDHIAGGFHRYATDEQWQIPHFEKMLYDNALQALAYLEAWQATRNPRFKQVTEEILKYVGRDMTAPAGAFYSATDADSRTPKGDIEEGWYFTWTPEELDKVLGKSNAAIVKKYYAVGKTPNFEGRYILHIHKNKKQTAAELNISEEALSAAIENAKAQLYTERNKRPAPLRDEKILTAWNALMISAFAKAGLALKNTDYIDRAVTAARFVMDHLYINNRLYRSYKDDQARHNACLEDYAFLIAACIDLYEATHALPWLKKAIALDKVLQQYYEDPENAAFFMTANDHETLIAREKPYYDNAIPSGNAVTAMNLLRLNAFTTDYRYKERAEKTFRYFHDRLTATPSALSEMLLALDYYHNAPLEIILILPKTHSESGDLLMQTFRERFIPNRIFIRIKEHEIAELSEIIPLISEKTTMDGRATAYVCKNGTCALPSSDPEAFAQQIEIR